MSPIRPDQRARYPDDWPAISREIRDGRAGGRCECEGECGRNHYRRVQDVQSRDGRPGAERDDRRCPARNGRPHPLTGSRVVLTVAHLDHQPENCDPDNLRAMCQRCHLAYDKHHHAEGRAERQGRPFLPFSREEDA